MKLREGTDVSKVYITISLVSLLIIVAFGFHIYVFNNFYEAAFIANGIHLNWGPLILLFLFCSNVTILVLKFLSLYFTMPFVIPMSLVWLVVFDWCILAFVKMVTEEVVKALKGVSK